jgi:acetylornithine deacetylase/succinyl-diaminopimelate desuccinylase-like protein
MGHTDVVPVNVERWQRDPFGGELVDDEHGRAHVWGRGAVDMLNLTASMAVAVKRLARSGFKPRGTLIYLAVADEEALGTYGAGHLVDHERDAVTADYVITESGGIPIPSPGGIKLPVIVGEKGTWWCTLRIKGTAGHASQPFRTDNALVTAAEVVRRLAEFRPPTVMHDVWRRFVESVGYPPEFTAPLLQEEGFLEVCDALPLGMARQFHACTHTTFAPTVIHGGSKTNVIPDTVDLEVDVRTLPGQTAAEVHALLDEALGDLAGAVEVLHAHDDPSTASPMDTPLWDSLSRVTKLFCEDSATVPFLTVGATDARFFRRAGATSYGFGLFSTALSLEDYGVMFHGDDERVDVESLRLSTAMWEAVARDLLVG